MSCRPVISYQSAIRFPLSFVLGPPGAPPRNVPHIPPAVGVPLAGFCPPLAPGSRIRGAGGSGASLSPADSALSSQAARPEGRGKLAPRSALIVTPLLPRRGGPGNSAQNVPQPQQVRAWAGGGPGRPPVRVWNGPRGLFNQLMVGFVHQQG